MGPCAIESEEQLMAHAKKIATIKDAFNSDPNTQVRVVFKACYNKANRTSANSFHGVGLIEGVRLLSKVKRDFGLEVTSDVHSEEEIAIIGPILDIIQIPHSLSRYTNIIQAAARTGNQVSIKKGTFMDAKAALEAVEKVRETGNNKPVVMIERGTQFGANDNVVDMRNFDKINNASNGEIITCIDASHPSGGRDQVQSLACAGMGAGAQAAFIECHITPEEALCDGKNMVQLNDMPALLGRLIAVQKTLEVYDGVVNESKANFI